MIEEIPFNKWSRERIEQGRKFCTSRSRKWNDPRVIGVIKLPLSVIKEWLWEAEGANSPEEFQKVSNQIFRYNVEGDKWFYVHFGDFRRGIGERKGVIPFKDTPFGSELIKAVKELRKNCLSKEGHFYLNKVLEILEQSFSKKSLDAKDDSESTQSENTKREARK